MTKITIVGRPNVGKSSLFNRLTGKRRSIVHNEPGVTRDTISETCVYKGKSFVLRDSAGFDPDTHGGSVSKAMTVQLKKAIHESDILFVMFDGKFPPTPLDREIVLFLRRVSKKMYFIVNKVDNPEIPADAYHFHELGLTNLRFISTIHDLGIDDLLDDVIQCCDDQPELKERPDVIKLAIIGRPNAGKSSLINHVLKQDRVIVTDVPGTTVDSVNIEATIHGRNVILIDTAGIRKKPRVTGELEHHYVARSFKSIDVADVVIMMLDIAQGLSVQDLKIIRKVEEKGKGIVLALNKSDLLTKEETDKIEFIKEINSTYKHLDYIPKQFVSAKTGHHVTKLFETAFSVYDLLIQNVPQTKLNTIVKDMLRGKKMPIVGKKTLRIIRVIKIKKFPIEFVFLANVDIDPGESFLRFLINQLRNQYDFKGCPIKISFRRV